VGKYEQASRTYQRVLELEPGNKLATEGLRTVAGMTSTAAEAAVANKGDAVAVAMGTAERQLLRQDLDGAERTLTEALAKSPNDMRLIMAMAQLYATVRNDPKVANEWIDKGLAITPNEERLLQFRAVLSSKDPYDRAIEVVRLQYPDPKQAAVYKYLTLADLQDRLKDMLARPGAPESEEAMLKKSQERAGAALPEALEAALKAAPGEESGLDRATLSAITRSDWDAVERYAATAEAAGERALAATLRSRSLLAQNKPDAAMQVLLAADIAGRRTPPADWVVLAVPADHAPSA
jgi:tetratricopeptide (TPR) repeat protein